MKLRGSSIVAYQKNEVNQQIVHIATQRMQPFKELVNTVQLE